MSSVAPTLLVPGIRRPINYRLHLVLAESLGTRVVTFDRRLYNGIHGGPLDHRVLWVADPL